MNGMEKWDVKGLAGWVLESGVEKIDLETAKELTHKYRGEVDYARDDRYIANLAGVLKHRCGFDVKVSWKDLMIYIKNHRTPTQIGGNGIRVLPVNAEDYLPRGVPEYVETDSEFRIYQAHLESGVPLLLVGPKGTGKTLSIAAFAAKNNIPIIQFDCSENTKRQDLIGRFLLVGDEVVYELGVMPAAIEVANQYGTAILVFEEINALSPNMQKVLNQLLDWRRHVYIPEIGKTFKLCPECKLLIVGTMNPSYYGGVHELNEDLRSRFAEIYHSYPSEDKEDRILSKISDLDEDVRKLIITLAIETRNGYARGELSYALSTRDLALFAELFRTYKETFGNTETALKFALRNTVVNRYDDSNERDTIRARILSIFGVEV